MPIRLGITNLPNNGGSPINRARYRVNSTTEYTLPNHVVGTYDTVAEVDDDVELAFGNAIGWGPYSAAKSITASSSNLLLNPSFTSDTVWAATTPGETLYTISGGNLSITRRADPGNAVGWDEGVAQDVEVINGREYDISITLISASGGGARIKIGYPGGYDVVGLNGITTVGTTTVRWLNTQFTGTSTRKFICSTSQQAAQVVYAEVSMTLVPL